MPERAGCAHLVRRFVGSIRPRPLSAQEEGWVRVHLLEGEVALWGRMSTADRRHSLGVARTVHTDLGEAATRPVLAAALLHDVGKVVSGLGTGSRVVATALARLGGHGRASRLSRRPGWPGRIGTYLLHDEIGAALLREAGSDPLTVAWAGGHHRGNPSVPAPVAAALSAAD